MPLALAETASTAHPAPLVALALIGAAGVTATGTTLPAATGWGGGDVGWSEAAAGADGGGALAAGPGFADDGAGSAAAPLVES